jgi:hypothetical protein
VRRELALLSAVVAGCSLPPLRGKAEPGRDPYAVFVADTPGGSDLFAILPSGGAPIQLTFSPVEESSPTLSPDGSTVLFMRRASGGQRSVWLLNLLSGSERELRLPRAWKAEPERGAWSADGRTIYVRTTAGVARVAAPPAAAAPALRTRREAASADSSFLVLLGAPGFAAVTACGNGLCTLGADGVSTPLAAPAHGAARWGADSVGWFEGERFTIRPLGGGHTRILEWSPAPLNPRELTYHPGAPPSPSS